MDNKEFKKYYTDENVVRLIAAQVAIISIAALLTFWAWSAILLLSDFAIRAFTRQPSLLSVTAKTIVDRLKLRPRPIYAAPKRFAAALGFTFTLSAIIFFLLKFTLLAYIISGVLIGCALLESVFKVCVGCYFFNALVAPIINRRNNKI